MAERSAAAMAQFFDQLQDISEPVGILECLCEHVAPLLGSDGAGVMIEDRDGHLRFVSATDPSLEILEQLQLALGEGPCLETMRTGAPIMVGDLSADTRWPTFGPQAMAAGLAAVFSFPLCTARTSIGALNVYRSTAGPLNGELAALGQVLSSLAATVLVATERAERAEEVTQSLQRALDSRVVIEQAKGKLAALMDVSPDEGFETIRGFARARNLVLRDVAAGIVDGALIPDVRDWTATRATGGDPSGPRRAPRSG